MHKVFKYVSVESEPLVIDHRQPEIETEPEQAEPAVVPVEDLIVRAVEEERLAARRQAESVIAEARQQAAAIIAEAEAQIPDIKEQATRQGQQEGYPVGVNEGREAAREQMKATIAAAANQASEILLLAQHEAKHMIVEAEQQIVDIVTAAMSKILAREIADNPMLVLPIVKAALEKVRDQEPVTIRVSPEDYDLVLQARRDLQAIMGREQALSILADQTIGMGSCMIDTPFGTVDARLDAQLETLIKVLQDVKP